MLKNPFEQIRVLNITRLTAVARRCMIRPMMCVGVSARLAIIFRKLLNGYEFLFKSEHASNDSRKCIHTYCSDFIRCLDTGKRTNTSLIDQPHSMRLSSACVGNKSENFSVQI